MNNKILTSSIIVIIASLILFFAYRVTKTPKIGTRTPINSLVVSILPIKYVVNSIVGNDFEITLLVPPGSSPEMYEPTPQQLRAVSRAALTFSTGLLDFEQELINRLPAVITDNRIINLSAGINLLEGSCSGTHENTHNHGIDPHIWTSPKQLKVMAKTAYSAIEKLCPDSVKYKENYLALRMQLDELDRVTAESIANSDVKCFFIYHPVLTYYANDYGIEQVSVEKEGKEPSAEYLKSLVNMARTKNINIIMFQREFSRSTVEAIAEDINAEAVMIDPLAEDIVNSIRQITNIIVSHN